MPPGIFKPVETEMSGVLSTVMSDAEEMGKTFEENLDTKPTKAVESFTKTFDDRNAEWQEKTTEWTELLITITDETLINLEAAFLTTSEYILEQLALMIEQTDLWREAIETIINTTLPALFNKFMSVANMIIGKLVEIIKKTDEWRGALETLTTKTLPALQRAGVAAFSAISKEVDVLINKITGEDGLISAIATMAKDFEDMSTNAVAGFKAITAEVNTLIGRLNSAYYWKKKLEEGGPPALEKLIRTFHKLVDEIDKLILGFKLAYEAKIAAEGPGGVGPGGGVVGDSYAAAVTPPQITAPALAGATTTNNIDLHFGPTTIGDGSDQALFEERVIQAVRDSIR